MTKGRISKGSATSVFEVKMFYFTLQGEFLKQEYEEMTATSTLAVYLDNKSPVKYWSTEFGGFIYLYVTSDLNTNKEQVQNWILNRNILYFYSLSNEGFKLETAKDMSGIMNRILMKYKLHKYRVMYDYEEANNDIGFLKSTRGFSDESKIYIVLDRRDDERARNMLEEVYLRELKAEAEMLANRYKVHSEMVNGQLIDEANEAVLVDKPKVETFETMEGLIGGSSEEDMLLPVAEEIIHTDSMDPHADDGLDEGDKSFKSEREITITFLKAEDIDDINVKTKSGDLKENEIVQHSSKDVPNLKSTILGIGEKLDGALN